MAHTRLLALNASFVPELGVPRSRRLAAENRLRLCPRYTAAAGASWSLGAGRTSTPPSPLPHPPAFLPPSRSLLPERTSPRLFPLRGCAALCVAGETPGAISHARGTCARVGRYMCGAGSTVRSRLVGRSVREGSEGNGGLGLPPQVDWLHGTSDPVAYDYDAVLVLGGDGSPWYPCRSHKSGDGLPERPCFDGPVVAASLEAR